MLSLEYATMVRLNKNKTSWCIDTLWAVPNVFVKLHIWFLYSPSRHPGWFKEIHFSLKIWDSQRMRSFSGKHVCGRAGDSDPIICWLACSQAQGFIVSQFIWTTRLIMLIVSWVWPSDFVFLKKKEYFMLEKVHLKE